MNEDHDVKNDLMDWNFIITYVTYENDGEKLIFWHLIGVDEIPNDHQRAMFMEEVKTDQEFDLPEEAKKGLKDVIMTKEEFEPLWNDMNGEENGKESEEEYTGPA